MSAQSTRHHKLLNNPTVLHTKTFFAPACHPCQKILSTSKYISDSHLSQNISLFTSLGLGLGLELGLGLGLGLWSYQTLACNWYESLHATTRVASYFYFCVFRKYYHTHKDRGVLDNPYLSQVLNNNKYGVVVGTSIQDSKGDIPLR